MNPLPTELWPLSRFVEYQCNPRKNDAAVDRMCASIQEFGFKIPCLARSNGELVDGHLRLKAARKLGLKEIPVILCDEWTSAQVKAFRLVVNRSATWAGWDLELLALELRDLEQATYDLSLTGFDSAELDELLRSEPTFPDAAFHKLSAQRSRALCAGAAAGAPEAPVSRAGDLWRLGPHRVLCGDPTDREAVAWLLSNGRPRLMVTDAPRGVELDGKWRVRADWSGAFALAPSLEVAYVWHASEFTREVLGGLLRIGFKYPEQIIWDKGRPAPASAHYWFAHEPTWYVRKTGAPWFGEAGKNSTIWSWPSPRFIMGGSMEDKSDDVFDHVSEKPVELMRKPIVNHLRRGEVVYDPFLGSGATLAAAELTARVCYGMELDPKYVDVAVERWQTLTGKQATREAGGRRFEEIAQERRGCAGHPDRHPNRPGVAEANGDE